MHQHSAWLKLDCQWHLRATEDTPKECISRFPETGQPSIRPLRRSCFIAHWSRARQNQQPAWPNRRLPRWKPPAVSQEKDRINLRQRNDWLPSKVSSKEQAGNLDNVPPRTKRVWIYKNQHTSFNKWSNRWKSKVICALKRRHANCKRRFVGRRQIRHTSEV